MPLLKEKKKGKKRKESKPGPTFIQTKGAPHLAIIKILSTLVTKPTPS